MCTEGLLSLLVDGFYMIILRYLAYPSFKLSSNRRHQIVSVACKANKTFVVMYTLKIIIEDHYNKAHYNGCTFPRMLGKKHQEHFAAMHLLSLLELLIDGEYSSSSFDL